MLKFKATPTPEGHRPARQPQRGWCFSGLSSAGLMFFKTRSKARAFASRTGRKVIDLGNVANSSRWGVKVV